MNRDVRAGPDRARQREREPGDRLAPPPRASAADEPGLVAQPARPVGPRQAPRQGQPAGRGLRLRRGEFATLDVEALKRDIVEVLTTSQDWWPADFGHYGGLIIRMSWHAAGTYRIARRPRRRRRRRPQRFAPLNSWPDNANLDKARRLLWPVKQKYGQKISWADLLVLAGNVALESMGFKTFGFGFGREDVWEPEEIFWGPEDTWLGDERYTGERELADAARRGPDGPDLRQPRGPQRQPRPARRGPRHPRDLPPDGDERRGDRRAHRRRATPSARPTAPAPRRLRRPEPEGRPLEDQGLGWKSTYGTGKGADTITSGLEVTWTNTPTQWGNGFFEILFGLRVGAHQEPGRRQPVGRQGRRGDHGPDAHDPSKKRKPTMLTTDLALRVDPAYEKISRRFLENPDEFAVAFAKAWYKLLHRDMGPVERYLGPWVPEPQLWQDPVPAVDHELIGDADVAAAQGKLLDSGLTVSQLVSTAWASAATFRGTDKRGGANGARIRLEPQRSWEVNEPGRAGDGAAGPRADPAGVQRRRRREGLAGRPDRPGRLRRRREGGRRRPRGHRAVPPGPHRRHPGADRRRVVRGARAAGRRLPQLPAPGEKPSPEMLLVDRAYLLDLTAPEMTVLVGGLRALGANVGGPSTASSPTGPGR